ncbi:MAG: dTDP-4-dehydrorhamnose reductase [Planctomycetota bacterium]
MRALVTGSSGQLGTRLLEALGEDRRADARGVDLPQFDVTRERDVEDAIASFRPDWVLNCAAFTDVEGAELDPDAAYRVNATAVRSLARACARRGAKLLHVSTDYVFSGLFRSSAPRPYAESDEPGPLNVYGASKLAGEIWLAAEPCDSIVVRTSWLYGGPTRNFLDAILERARAALAGGPPLRVVDDQVGTPTDAWSLARQIRRLLAEDVRGLVHAACAGATSWYGFAREILRAARLEVPIEAIPTSAYPARARRPSYSVLANRRLEELGLCVLPTWEAALGEALRRRGLA